MQFSVDSVCSVITDLSCVPWVNAFNQGKSCAVLAVFFELFSSPPPN